MQLIKRKRNLRIISSPNWKSVYFLPKMKIIYEKVLFCLLKIASTLNFQVVTLTFNILFWVSWIKVTEKKRSTRIFELLIGNILMKILLSKKLIFFEKKYCSIFILGFLFSADIIPNWIIIMIIRNKLWIYSDRFLTPLILTRLCFQYLFLSFFFLS